MIPRFYPIVDVGVCERRGIDPVGLAGALLDAGVRLLQIRDKRPSTAARLALADAIIGVRSAIAPSGSGLQLRLRGQVRADPPARIIVNDRADIAALSGADGVHVGQDDLPVEDVRRLLGPDAIVGVSTHSADQIDAAIGTSATYIAVGPVYGTGTKDTGYTPRGLDLVRRAAARAGRPVVAIGGITLARAAEAIGAGADAVAVITDLLDGDDGPAARARQFTAALGRP